MKKKDFCKLIQDNKNDFVCIDATSLKSRFGSNLCQIRIVWKGLRYTSIKTIMKEPNSVPAMNEIQKYRNWAKTITP